MAARNSRPEALQAPGRRRHPAWTRLKNRADFLRAARGIRRVEARRLTLELCPTPDGAAAPDTHARRFHRQPRRSAMPWPATAPSGGCARPRRGVLPLLGRAGHDYVLVARGDTLTRPFADALLADVTGAP